MAVGYERLNTSAARSRGIQRKEIPRDKIVVTKAGAKIWDATYGYGVTREEFVSNSDNVQCEFASGYNVTLRGGAVRIGIVSAEKKSGE